MRISRQIAVIIANKQNEGPDAPSAKTNRHRERAGAGPAHVGAGGAQNRLLARLAPMHRDIVNVK